MKLRNDIKGKVFGRLIPLEISAKRTKHGGTIWLCLCICGNLTYVYRGNLTRGNTCSCGCLRKERSRERKVEAHPSHKHGGYKTRLYRIWAHMKDRCYNQKNEKYKNYGGKGITVYSKWKNDFATFRNWALENGYQGDLTIDRINNDGNYEPPNCQFLTRAENARKGTKRVNNIER